MAGTTLRVGRSRGAFSGLLLVLLGIWGGLVPMVGPYLHYAYTPDKAWTVTSGRIWLEFLPAAAVLIGGLLVMGSKFRPAALSGACLALASGAWFIIGSLVSRLWMHTPIDPGSPVGGSVARTVEQIGFFSGLGAVIICIAALALGRLSVVSARDVRLAERLAAQEQQEADAATAPVPVTTAPVETAPVETTTTTTTDGGTTKTTRRAPLAVLTRIASRNGSGSDNPANDSLPNDLGSDSPSASDSSASALPKRERVGSGTSTD